MSADLNSIEIGIKGKVKMLQSVFGSSDKDKPKGKPNANDIRSFAATHNALSRAGKVKK